MKRINYLYIKVTAVFSDSGVFICFLVICLCYSRGEVAVVLPSDVIRGRW